ncbi:MAG: PilN domain-containing protein [Planctomycetota bacterium]
MNQIDFLPKRIRHHRLLMQRLRRQGVALLLFVAALAMLAWGNERRIAHARAELDVKQADLAQLAQDLEILPELNEQLADGQIKRRISAELGSRLNINALLAELERRLPADACLTSLQCSTVEVARPATERLGSRGRLRRGSDEQAVAVPKRVRIMLTGLAPAPVDVATFLGDLGSSPLFTDVEMGYSKTIVVPKVNREATSFQVSFLVAE